MCKSALPLFNTNRYSLIKWYCTDWYSKVNGYRFRGKDEGEGK
ncbi:hypothetical protein GPAL_3345 [Glaciecola pallidula DSM 14239 = ACAM 615]|uniref:Uncharacterized protein n=1 Tax=Brumicola pallidula DSM 14239 = ACAM 615 TaxID=1121922 RepID=K6ZMT0_9ALTE|nr:hypothetical protein GPAL_3345 [Glaciecola pallidula DSM 14239 = ACAM 615]